MVCFLPDITFLCVSLHRGFFFQNKLLANYTVCKELLNLGEFKGKQMNQLHWKENYYSVCQLHYYLVVCHQIYLIRMDYLVL